MLCRTSRARRREHIEKLAAEMSATVEYGTERYGMHVDAVNRILYLADWNQVPEEEMYWVGLHELGHLALTDEGEHSHTLSRIDDYMAMDFGLPHWGAEREALAWAWAIDHADRALEQAGESSIAWGLADRLFGEYVIGDGLRRIARELGDDPDWFFNVTEPEHFAKLDGYARPNWQRLIERIAAES